MNLQRFPRWPTAVILAMGAGLHILLLLHAASKINGFSVSMLIAGVLPYLVCFLVAWYLQGRAFAGFTGGVMALAFDFWGHQAVLASDAAALDPITMLFWPVVTLAFGVTPGVIFGLLATRRNS